MDHTVSVMVVVCGGSLIVTVERDPVMVVVCGGGVTVTVDRDVAGMKFQQTNPY